MDVLQPELEWVDGRCYRINSTKEKTISSELTSQDNEDTCTSESYNCSMDEPCDADIKEVDGKFRVDVPVPSAFYSYIIGSKGATKKRIETETKTRVSVPKQGSEGSIIITGSDMRGIISAKTRIEVLMNSARQKTPFTHFISIPFNVDPVKSGFLDFKDDVLRNCSDCRGIEESIFQNPNKLHLTIGTLVLLSNDERQNAAALLKECQTNFINQIIGNRPLELQVEGIEYMNDDPAEADVLYARIKNSLGFNDLLKITDLIVSKFVESGLMLQEYDRVKLHLTIMNTLYRKKHRDDFQSPRSKGKVLRETFNATEVLNRFGSYVFGTVKVSRIELSQLHSTSSDGYYGCTAQVKLPI